MTGISSIHEVCDIWYYAGVGLFLLLFETIYLRIARRCSITDKVGLESSYRGGVPTGGGVIIFLSVLIFICWHTYTASGYLWTLLGSCTILAIISFIDDITPMPPEFRLMIQVLVIAFAFHGLIHEDSFDIFVIILLLGTGLVNAYNFMDGINGMLVSYSVVFLTTMQYYISQLHAEQTDGQSPQIFQGLIFSLILATLVLAIFNFRRKALVFSGDVGSITMGYCVMFIMASTILYTSDATIIVFLLVYAVDTVYTIVQRLCEGERITLPHRKHIYQILVYKRGYSHLSVSVAYAAVQLLINLGYFLIPAQLHWTYVITTLLTLTVAYFVMKRGYFRKKFAKKFGS